MRSESSSLRIIREWKLQIRFCIHSTVTTHFFIFYGHDSHLMGLTRYHCDRYRFQKRERKRFSLFCWTQKCDYELEIEENSICIMYHVFIKFNPQFYHEKVSLSLTHIVHLIIQFKDSISLSLYVTHVLLQIGQMENVTKRGDSIISFSHWCDTNHKRMVGFPFQHYFFVCALCCYSATVTQMYNESLIRIEWVNENLARCAHYWVKWRR
jgi:hypothetical protein